MIRRWSLANFQAAITFLRNDSLRKDRCSSAPTRQPSPVFQRRHTEDFASSQYPNLRYTAPPSRLSRFNSFSSDATEAQQPLEQLRIQSASKSVPSLLDQDSVPSPTTLTAGSETSTVDADLLGSIELERPSAEKETRTTRPQPVSALNLRQLVDEERKRDEAASTTTQAPVYATHAYTRDQHQLHRSTDSLPSKIIESSNPSATDSSSSPSVVSMKRNGRSSLDSFASLFSFTPFATAPAELTSPGSSSPGTSTDAEEWYGARRRLS